MNLKPYAIPSIVALSAIGMVGCGSPSSGSDVTQAAHLHHDRMGVQLYTLRTEMEKSVPGTLTQVSKIGYEEVELAGLFELTPEQFQDLLIERDLAPISSHVSYAVLRDDPQAAIDQTLRVGAQYIVMPYLPAEERQTLAQWHGWIDVMNNAAKLATQQGLVFAYHNHEFEFEPVEGGIPFDLILKETDPEFVKIELDVFWASLAGADPVAIIEANPGRIPLLHIKDLRNADRKMVSVGDGDIDFAAILAAGQTAGVKHYFIEHDNPEDPFASISRAYGHIKTLDF